MMRASSLILAAAITAGAFAGLANSAFADDGWYVSAGTGVNDVPTLKPSNTIAGVNPAKVGSSLGMVIVGSGGYAFGPVRVEGEFGWRDNDVDKVSTPSLGARNGSGNLQPLSFMANAYYDIDLGSSFTPYIGAGVGAVDIQNRISEAGTTITNTDRFGFGYQGIAGVAYRVSDALSLKADYRYMATTATDIPDDTGSVGSGTAKLAYQSHAVLVGFIYRFGTEPKPMPAPAPQPAAATTPPPAPPPAPAPQIHNFMVFFDFDKSEITPEAHTIIEQVAKVAKSQNAARIDLTGHTDLAGPGPYNMKLSIRRAEAVKKVLVELGIPADEIGVVGKGKTEPLVPTPDGVREPKNRRVEIVLP